MFLRFQLRYNAVKIPFQGAPNDKFNFEEEDSIETFVLVHTDPSGQVICGGPC